MVPVFGAYDFSVSKTYEIHSSPSIRLFIALVCNISFHITFYRAKVTEMAVFGFWKSPKFKLLGLGLRLYRSQGIDRKNLQLKPNVKKLQSHNIMRAICFIASWYCIFFSTLWGLETTIDKNYHEQARLYLTSLPEYRDTTILLFHFHFRMEVNE